MPKMGKMTVLIAVGVVAAYAAGAFAQDQETKQCPMAKKGGKRNPEEMFQKMDANTDAVVTKEEFLAFQAARQAKPGRPGPTKEMMEKHFAEMDADSDGKVTKDEFLTCAAKMKAKRGDSVQACEKKADGEVKCEKPAEEASK